MINIFTCIQFAKKFPENKFNIALQENSTPLLRNMFAECSNDLKIKIESELQ